MESAEDPELEAGTQIGAFRIVRLLGAGGTGSVYEGVEPTLHKRVAIKILKRSFAKDPPTLDRFRREAQAANDARHPGIVEVFGSGVLEDGRPYLVMSLLEGRSLRAEIDACGRLQPRRAWAIAREIAEALLAAHEAGIIHRDLKPDNVFLEAQRDRPERARVLDFGLAKILATRVGALDTEDLERKEGAAGQTQTGTMVGTPLYMAPEQWFNTGIESATDQYALGAMLFEMIVGGPPFRAQRLSALLQQHLHEAPPRLEEKGVAVPRAVEALIARTLAKTPSERFESMAAFIREGDAAFGTPLPLAAPFVGESEARGVTVLAPPGALGRALLAHAAILVVGLSGILAVGYTGPERHDPRYWSTIAGHQAFIGYALFALGLLALPLVARARLRRGAASLGWGFCLAPALSGALGTYAGWLAVHSHLDRAPATGRFAFVSLGMYEANASRFMGFAMAGILCLSGAALARASSPVAKACPPEPLRELAAGLVGLAILAVAAAVAGAPSGALVAGAGAMVIVVGRATSGRLAEGGARELERTLMGLLSLLFIIGVGFARIEAREGYLWDPEALQSRVARATEIIAAAGERTATTIIALATFGVLLAVEGRRLQRLLRLRLMAWPRGQTWVLLGVLALAAVLDATLYARMLGTRDGYRVALAAQFALLGRLDPPLATGLDAARFRASDAPALQLTRDVVAVNADALARLSAKELEPRLRSRLTDVLAKDAARRAVDSPDRSELLVTVDREVPYAIVARILYTAHEAGVRRIELLFVRSRAPTIPAGRPIEASYLIPSDFVAVPAELKWSGLRASPEEPFHRVARRIIERVRGSQSGASAISIAVSPSP